jgi:hypothetical protein
MGRARKADGDVEAAARHRTRLSRLARECAALAERFRELRRSGHT